MKAVLAVLLSRAVLSGLAVLVLCALVWFLGPLLGTGTTFPLEPAFTREVLIAALVLVWAVLTLRRWRKARARERKLLEGLARTEAAPVDPDQTAGAEEVALLGERLRTAMTALRGGRRRNPFRPSHLYDLPWYLFIGPPGAGKTTALRTPACPSRWRAGTGRGRASRAWAAPASATGGSPTRRC